MTPDLNSLNHLQSRIRDARSRLLLAMEPVAMAQTPPARIAALNDLESWLGRFPRHESFLNSEGGVETYGFTEADRILAAAESALAE